MKRIIGDDMFGDDHPFVDGQVLVAGTLTPWRRFTDRLRWLVGMKERYRFRLACRPTQTEGNDNGD